MDTVLQTEQFLRWKYLIWRKVFHKKIMWCNNSKSNPDPNRNATFTLSLTLNPNPPNCKTNTARK